MTSKVKTLIIGAIVVVLLVVVLVVLKVTEPKDPEKNENSTSNSQTSSDTLIKENLDDFKSIKVENKNGQYTIKKVEVDKEKKEYKYIISELEKFNQKESNVQGLVSNVNSLYSSSKIMDEVDDVAKYGLDNPTSTVTYDVADKKHIVKVGNKAPDGTFYAMVDDNKALYTINSSVANTFSSNYLSYLDTTLIPLETKKAEDGTTSTPKITNFELERVDLPSKIKLVSNDAKDELAYSSLYKMVSPIESQVNFKIDTDYMAKIFGMTANSVEAIYDNSKASEYGFDKPTAIIRVQYDNKDQKIIVGNKNENGEYRVLVNDNGLVYNASEDALVFMKVTADEMISGLAIVPSITTVSTVNVMIDGKNYKYDLTNEKVKEKNSDEETLKTTKVTYNNKELDLEMFRKYYQLLLTASVERINYDGAKGKLIASIEYKYTSGGSDKIELYQAENRTMIVAINGQAKYEGRIAYYDKLVKETQNLLSGKTVDTDW